MEAIKKIGFTLLSLIAVAILAIKFNYDNTKAFDSIIYFLTIATGFNITAFSIIANSQFSKHLYNIQDASDNSKTLLHTLVGKFKYSTTLFLITIALILFFHFIEGGDSLKDHFEFYISGRAFTFPLILKSTIWTLTVISFVKFYGLVTTFSKFVTQSASKQ